MGEKLSKAKDNVSISACLMACGVVQVAQAGIRKIKIKLLARAAERVS